ncbi:MAG: hypothetical protein REI45_14505 [Propionicimonas sp.]|nr:hypothetical protein [Propionicimonas sp.]
MRTSTGSAAPPEAPPHPGVRLWGWGALALAVALVHNRLWASPNLSLFARISAEWGRQPFEGERTADYLLTNLSMPGLARVLGQTDPHAYARLHLLVLVAGLGACVALAYRNLGYLTARTLAVLCAAAPGVTVALQWLGQPDALMFPVGLALVLVRSRPALAALAFVAAATHPEQAVFMVAVAIGARAALAVAEERFERRHTVVEGLTALGGVIAARVVLQWYLWAADIRIRNPRSSYVDLGADLFWRHHTQGPWQLVYLLWGPLWAVVVAVAVWRWRARGDGAARPWAVLAVLAVLALVPVAVTLDETRVYAMITAPVVAGVAVLLARQWSATALLRAGSALLVLTLVLPGGFTAGIASWAWDFTPSEFVPFLWSGEHPGELDVWLMSPFRFVIPV